MKLNERLPRHAVVAIAIAVLIGGCTKSSAPSTGSAAATTTPPTDTDATGADAKGAQLSVNGATPRLFDVSLSKGDMPAVAVESNALASGSPLSADRVAELIARLPRWDDPSTLATPFKWPAQSPPPPRTGTVVTESFPPSDTTAPPPVDSGPLQVLRVQPEGEVPIAAYLSVTFNQPMVAVGTLAQLTPADAPVKLTPAIDGRWQWIGTRTLRFDADSTAVDRLPMATTFTATVPAGTKSAVGGTLATAATFTFTTPAPIVESFAPRDSDSIDPQPVFVATFDQRVDQASVLATITLDADGAIPLRLATKAEIDADETAKNIVANAEEGRWIAFGPERPMPTDTSFTVAIGPRTPSAEGPLTTTAAQSFSGRTYGPLQVKRVACAYGNDCPPGTPITVEFTNPLDEKAAANKDVKLTVRPALAGETVTVNQVLLIEGATKARTTYKFTLPASLTDIHGQRLAKSETVEITIGSAQPSLRQLDLITTLDPFSKAQKLSVLTVNHRELRVRVFEADPAEFSDYVEYTQSRYDDKTRLPGWKVLADSKVKTNAKQDTTVETQIDLSGPLGGKPGQVIVLVEAVPAPARGTDEFYENLPILTWVQSTTMALDSFSDGSAIRAWATDLRTGAPLSGIDVTSWDHEHAGVAGPAATTDSIGLAVLALRSGSAISFVQGRRGEEAFILPVHTFGTEMRDLLRWYAFDDRQIYRPGETLHLKGWVREVDGTTNALTVAALKQASYVVSDAFGVELTTGTLSLGALGGFDLTIDIPATANTGSANIVFTAATGDSSGYHSFQIAEFRRPEFEVDVEPVTATPFLSTSPVTMTAQASYYAGGPLPNSPVAWSVSTAETTFSPAGWDDFTFGIFRPWWFIDFDGPSARIFPYPTPSR